MKKLNNTREIYLQAYNTQTGTQEVQKSWAKKAKNKDTRHDQSPKLRKDQSNEKEIKALKKETRKPPTQATM